MGITFLAIPFLNLKIGCSTSIRAAHLADMAASGHAEL
jgi:hypothetical protein